jgi:hypothetical protein
VALLALSAELNRTTGQLVHLGRADLGLFQRDAGDLTSPVLPLSLLPQLGGVADDHRSVHRLKLLTALQSDTDDVSRFQTYGRLRKLTGLSIK